MLRAKIQHPDFPEGYEFSVEGLGIFKNGEEREVTAEQEQSFVNVRRSHVKDALKDHPHLSVSGEPEAEVPESETEEASFTPVEPENIPQEQPQETGFEYLQKEGE